MFGKKRVSNSEIADRTHARQTRTPEGQEEREVEKEEEEVATWESMTTYPMFETNNDADGNWEIAKCSVCGGEFAWGEWDGNDEF